MENFKVKIESIESKLNSIGKTFDFLSDRDGSQRRKVDSLQAELLSLQRQKADIVNIFWKVKEIVEAKLKHFSGLLRDVEK